jgi:hypothetical protein
MLSPLASCTRARAPSRCVIAESVVPDKKPSGRTGARRALAPDSTGVHRAGRYIEQRRWHHALAPDFGGLGRAVEALGGTLRVTRED